MNFINLTPHDITIVIGDKKITVPASGTVARVTAIEKIAGDIDGIPLIKREFGEVENLPAPKEDTIYTVSSLVLSAVNNRQDVVAPDTGATAIRDTQGRIIAVTRLVTP